MLPLLQAEELCLPGRGPKDLAVASVRTGTSPAIEMSRTFDVLTKKVLRVGMCREGKATKSL